MDRDETTLERYKTAASPEERFHEYLQSRGMRSTRQRQVLLEQVFAQHDHFDADQLIEKLPRRGDADYVSRPTVYRTLGEFVDAGLLKKFEVDGRGVYEFDYGYPEHDHLHCSDCDRLIEFQADGLEQILREVAERHGFRVKDHTLIVDGVCEECFRAKRRSRRRLDRI
jgi:Fur family transcriptional regulator, ferric uptake regulator